MKRKLEYQHQKKQHPFQHYQNHNALTNSVNPQNLDSNRFSNDINNNLNDIRNVNSELKNELNSELKNELNSMFNKELNNKWNNGLSNNLNNVWNREFNYDFNNKGIYNYNGINPHKSMTVGISMMEEDNPSMNTMNTMNTINTVDTVNTVNTLETINALKELNLIESNQKGNLLKNSLGNKSFEFNFEFGENLEFSKEMTSSLKSASTQFESMKSLKSLVEDTIEEHEDLNVETLVYHVIACSPTHSIFNQNHTTHELNDLPFNQLNLESIPIELTLPSHKSPHIYRSASELSNFLLFSLHRLPWNQLKRLKIIELGSGYSALPSIVCIYEFVKRMFNEEKIGLQLKMDEILKNKEAFQHFCNERGIEFHICITDGADKNEYSKMKQTYIYNLNQNLSQLISELFKYVSSMIDIHETHINQIKNTKNNMSYTISNNNLIESNYNNPIGSKDKIFDSFKLTQSSEKSNFVNLNHLQSLSNLYSFKNMKWKDFYRTSRDIHLIIASDTIHNRNKESWDDFFACVAYCLRKTLFQPNFLSQLISNDISQENIHSQNMNIESLVNDDKQQDLGNLSSDSKRLWLMIQMRDENENIEHFLKKWKLGANLLNSDESGTMLLFEIKSLT